MNTMYLLSRWDITPGVDKAIDDAVDKFATQHPIIMGIFFGMLAITIVVEIVELFTE